MGYSMNSKISVKLLTIVALSQMTVFCADSSNGPVQVQRSPIHHLDQVFEPAAHLRLPLTRSSSHPAETTDEISTVQMRRIRSSPKILACGLVSSVSDSGLIPLSQKKPNIGLVIMIVGGESEEPLPSPTTAAFLAFRAALKATSKLEKDTLEFKKTPSSVVLDELSPDKRARLMELYRCLDSATAPSRMWELVKNCGEMG